MATSYIGVGSNIEPEENISEALKKLSVETTVLEVSSFYKTPFVNESGLVDEAVNDFYNGVFKVEVFFEPFTLKSYLRSIEEELGRVREGDTKFSPRTIDLDILIYDNYIIDEPGLTIPDPDIWTREFVAVPLMELMGEAAELPTFDDGSTNVLEPSLKAVAESLKSDNMAYLGGFTGHLKTILKTFNKA